MAGDSIFGGPAMIEPGGAIIWDYYVLRVRGEAAGVIAKKDFNDSVTVVKNEHGEIMRINRRTAFWCESITKPEYDTYIAFGIPDFGVKTSWKKWMKSWLRKLEK